VKRPSSLTISTPAAKLLTPAAKLFAPKRDSSSEDVSAPSKDSESDSFSELVAATATAAPTVSDTRGDGVDVERAKEAPIALGSKTRKAKAVESSSGSGSGAVAPLGNANALVAALASLQAQVELLTSEKAAMEAEVAAARTTIQNLEQKVAASEQSSDLFARQLANVKESFQAKLLAREEEVSLEKMALAKERETQLQHQQARFTTEAELWKHEIAALTKVKLELESEKDRLTKELSDEVLHRGFAEVKHRTLKSEHTRTCEELQMLLQERERFGHAQIELQTLRGKMTETAERHRLEREQLEARVDSMQLERADHVAGWERERQARLRQNEREKAKLLQFAQEVRGLHHLLQLSVAEAREQLQKEVKRTKETLESVQQQASGFAVHQSDREVALMSRKGRILQLETQLKNDRQTINQLEATLAKSTRALEKRYAALSTKFQGQKEHLEITLAVRQGLTTDLQAKRKQVAELEREVARLNLAKGKADVKVKHAQQQILAMQKLHARELDKRTTKLTATGASSKAVLASPEPSQEENVRVVLAHVLWLRVDLVCYWPCTSRTR
jgi:chromosome segregation ATPase